MQDAMARDSRFAKPNLFLTIICNPKWPEIQSSLLPGQTASDRPDIVARVFILKVTAIMDLILKRHVLGKVKSYVGMIEFQKRGLPHFHLLLIMTDSDKPDTVEDIDRLVSAQIPDPVTHPLFHYTIARHMMHGPCGELDPSYVCMVDKPEGAPGKKHCGKRYPQEFGAATEVSCDGYPIYARSACMGIH